MSKVGLITIHRVLNYGTVWQAYSTVQLLQSLGMNVQVIDYIPDRLKIAHLKDFLFELNPVYAHSWKKIPYLMLRVPTRFLEKKAFDHFVERCLPLTDKKYYNIKQLEDLANDYNVLITGSDQVWNYEEELQDTVDKAYLLDFTLDSSVDKIAFSASFGRDEFPERILNDIQPHILKYRMISVREKSGLNILQKLGYLGAVHSFDPTLVFGKEKLSRLASNRLVKDKYLLVYSLSPNSAIGKTATYIAKRLGLRIVKLCNNLEKEKYVDKYFRFRKPEDFLSLFYYADYIVTNSFHGTAFSVNFNKQFSTICADKFEARMVDFLNNVNLSERLIYAEKDFERQFVPIDFTEANLLIQQNRNEMLLFLQQALKRETED